MLVAEPTPAGDVAWAQRVYRRYKYSYSGLFVIASRTRAPAAADVAGGTEFNTFWLQGERQENAQSQYPERKDISRRLRDT